MNRIPSKIPAGKTHTTTIKEQPKPGPGKFKGKDTKKLTRQEFNQLKENAKYGDLDQHQREAFLQGDDSLKDPTVRNKLITEREAIMKKTKRNVMTSTTSAAYTSDTGSEQALERYRKDAQEAPYAKARDEIAILKQAMKVSDDSMKAIEKAGLKIKVSDAIHQAKEAAKRTFK